MEVSVRRFTPGDLKEMQALLADAQVMRFLEPPFPAEKTRAFLAAQGLCAAPRIFAAESEGRFIGYVIFHDYDASSMEIGWVLKKAFWRRGLAKKLTAILIERAFTCGKDAVIECAPGQMASRRIAELFGFRYEGMREGLMVYRLCKPEKE